MLVRKVFENAFQSELWGFAAVSLLVFIVYMLRNYLKSIILALKLPGPPVVPLLGNCLLIKEKDFLRNTVNTAFGLYGSLIRVWVLFFPFFLVLQPDDLQLILASKKHTNKTFFYRFMHNFLGNGLITRNGEQWHTHRRLIQPTFHLSFLERFISTFADASQSLFESLDPLDNQEINVTKYVNNCVLDILNEAVLGIPVKKKKYYTDMEKSPFRQGKLIVSQRFFKPWLLFNGIYRLTKLSSEELAQNRRLNEFTRKIIKQRRDLKGNNNNDNEMKCLLDYMIELSDNNPREFTEEDIVNEACTFMLAGQDSVGAATAFTLYLLAQNDDCQKKCWSEIEHIFGNDQRPPTMQDLREMRYLEMCIKESLRLYPSVPLLARQLGEEVRLSKYTLPAGSNVFICPYATHRLPHIYPNPENFIPERFASEHSEERHPYAYLPFSAGPRYCIGNRFALMEMKTIISRLLRSFEILKVENKSDLTAIYRVTLRASGGLWVRLRSRESKLMVYSS
uniref:Cytochrome P450 n=1 Tax=Glossina morsitans morsitans TaxID=37546 RepID=A0A1B0FKK0_GLOMM